MPGGPLQLHRLGGAQGRPGRIPLADAQEDAVARSSISLRVLLAPVMDPEEHPSAIRRPAAVDVGSDGDGEAAVEFLRVEEERGYWSGMPASGRARSDPAKDAGIGLRLSGGRTRRPGRHGSPRRRAPALPASPGPPRWRHPRARIGSRSRTRTRRPHGHAGPARKSVPCRSEATSRTWGRGRAPRWIRSRHPPMFLRLREDTPCSRSNSILAVWQSRGMPTLGGPHLPRPDPPNDGRGSPKRPTSSGLTVYAGFRPLGRQPARRQPDAVCTLRRFQDAGHRTISLAGGGTGMIGDPGGKQDERQLLDLQTIGGGVPAEAIRPSWASSSTWPRAVSFLLNNADWLLRLAVDARVPARGDVGKHFTINHMMAKESCPGAVSSARIRGISYTEFSYMLLQAYDFLRLHRRPRAATLCSSWWQRPVGATSPWGSTTSGWVCGDEVWGFTTPLIVKGGWDEVPARPNRATGCKLPSGPALQPMVPVLPQHARRIRWSS